MDGLLTALNGAAHDAGVQAGQGVEESGVGYALGADATQGALDTVGPYLPYVAVAAFVLILAFAAK